MAAFVRVLFAVTSRGLVYGSGFVLLLLISRLLPPEQFGRYSIMQSALEVSAIVATLGSGVLVMRETTATGALNVGGAGRTLLVGLPMALVALFGILAGLSLDLNVMEAAFIGVVLMASAAASLLLFALRATNKNFLYILDPAIRAAIVGAGLAFLFLLNASLSVSALLGLNAIVIAFTGLAYGIFSSTTISFTNARPQYTLHEQFTLLLSGLAGFAVRKADLLVLGLLLPVTSVASYKLAFLVAEVPYQFCQIYLVQNQKDITEPKHRLEVAKKHYVTGLLLSAGTSLIIAAIFPFIADLIFPHFDVGYILYPLLLAFLIRSAAFPHELILIYAHESRANMVILFVSTIARFSLLYVFVVNLIDVWYLFAVPAAAIEYVLYEIALRRSLGTGLLTANRRPKDPS
jgi:O-antigen/teichoic acid export membrane protein